MNPAIFPHVRKVFQDHFPTSVELDAPLAKYTSARIGGPAEMLLTVSSANQLADATALAWDYEVPYLILGAGSNMLVSDRGVSGVVILNKARNVVFDEEAPSVWAESGSNFGAIARQAGRKGFSGLEWAAGIPGTVGGAVVGNAGAHGGDTAGNLILAEVLHYTKGRQSWRPEDLAYDYRTSTLKTEPGRTVVLAATFRLEFGEPEEIKAEMDKFLAFRRRTQPPGASMGSMFKNPPGDYAGRLIDQAGLKGLRIGDAQISELHGNFFLNHGGATADQVYSLISQARQEVEEKFGVRLELEIEIIGEWDE
jgi:UDP-N-acetylmuramate dehydrogenase